MAATNSTTNLGLPQWEATDKPERTDFNTAMSDIDTNLNLVDNTVAAHLAESANKHIKESGSNANGRYIKFDDGTMICTKIIVLGSTPVTTASGGWYLSSVINTGNWPVAFVGELPAFSVHTWNSSEASSTLLVSTGPTLTNGPRVAIAIPASLTLGSANICLKSTGRWK